jgi:hypothetical protein
MSYREWYETHGKRHREIVERLRAEGVGREEIIAYFDFENMCVHEPDFCPLYERHEKCHDMPRLNCYMCACPFFRFTDTPSVGSDGLRHYSFCSIRARKARRFVHEDEEHLDCSKCLVPHHTGFIRKRFDYDWFEMMKASPLTPPKRGS